MDKHALLSILEEVTADVEAGRIVTASEKIKRLAVALDKEGLGKALHLIQYA